MNVPVAPDAVSLIVTDWVIVPLKKSRIYYLTHVAAIPHHKIGQTVLFREDEILEWMERNKVA